MNEYRTIDIGAWTKVGAGNNGSAYVNPNEPDVILKVNKPELNTEAFVRHEFEVSKAVAGLGLPAPKMYEMVRVAGGYGTLAERVKQKRSLARICADDPGRTEEMARLLCEKFKILSGTPCNTDFFPSRKEQMLRTVDKVQFIGKKNRRILRAFAESTPEVTTCSHGDFSMGNMVLSDDGYYWIDLDRFAYGSPMFDIGHLYMICNYYATMKQTQEIFHMDEALFRRFWDAFAKAYTGQEDHAAFDREAHRYAATDVALRYEFTNPSLPERIFFSILLRRLLKDFNM